MRISPILVSKKKGNIPMLMTIAILLILLYALGLITSYTMGGLIHLLLVVALVVVLVRLIQGRRVL
jgi:asparagine N-glycosylation enzyme membrane subunit Stt3